MEGCNRYEMTIDLNVLNHLGINLYSSTPPVLSEVVANSYDADATRVDIKILPYHWAGDHHPTDDRIVPTCAGVGDRLAHGAQYL